MKKSKFKKAAESKGGKKKLIFFNDKLLATIKNYCMIHNIDNESDLIRQAVIHYCEQRGYDDSTLQLTGLKKIESQIEQLIHMVMILFNYTHTAHESNLIYHPEIDDRLKEAAVASAQYRLNTFFKAFQERLKKDTTFFNKILMEYKAGNYNG